VRVPDLASVNGRVTPLGRAVVRLQDRGFLLGDGVYEVLRTYGGRLFALDAHLDRLEASLRGARIRMPVSRRALARHLAELLRRSGYREARLYVQITRGTAPRQHSFPRGVSPTLVVYVERLPRPETALHRRGVHAVTLRDPRWQRCDLKAIGLLANVLAKQQALEAGAEEVIFLGPDGHVREGSTANVFAVRDGAVWTHPLGPEILPGVSRAVVLQVARQAGMRVREARFTRAALWAADEVFLSSTMAEVLPVVRIDGRRIGQGRPGPVAARLWRLFRAQAETPLRPRRAGGTPVRATTRRSRRSR
jgi:D-alanine transaminase